MIGHLVNASIERRRLRKRTCEGRRPARILLLRYGAAGDVLRTADLVRDLCSADPPIEIHLACAESVRPIAGLLPEVRVHRLANPYGGWASFAAGALAARRLAADLVVALHPGRRMALLAALATGRSSLDFGPGGLPWPEPAGTDLRRTFCQVARVLGIPPARRGPLLEDPPLATRKGVERRVAELPGGDRLVLVAPGGGGGGRADYRRRWLPEGFGRVAGALRARGCRVAIVGTRDEASALPLAPEIGDWRGETTVEELALLVARADLVLANDSLIAVLAGIQRTKALVLAGATAAERGLAEGVATTVLRSGECSPCWGDLAPSQPCAHDLVCMRALSWEHVLKESLRLLDGPTAA